MIWTSALPKHVRPDGLDPNKDWWLSTTTPGGLQDSRTYANRDPVGFTDENGYFTPYSSFLIEHFQPTTKRNMHIITAQNGEDVAEKVRRAFLRYPAIRLHVPKGVTAKIESDRIDVINRILHVIVDGSLECKHRVKQSPYVNSGDWYEVSQFLLGAGGTVHFSGIGDIKHLVGDVGAANLAPYNCGFVSGLAYNPVNSPVAGNVIISGHHFHMYLSTSLLNHEGGGSHFNVSAMGGKFEVAPGFLATSPFLITKGSWAFSAGSVTLETSSVTFLNSISRGTSGNADGAFSWNNLTDRNPSYHYS